ncbi:MAG: pilin [Saezia sp.]
MTEQQKNETVDQVQQAQAPRTKKKPSIVRVIILLLIIGGLAAAFIYPQFCDYTTRTRVAEGLVLASSAKNLVVDNAVNGLPLDHGWSPIMPTKNTQAIFIDEVSGVITIVSNPKSTEGGVVLALTPTVDGARLMSGKEPVGRISWECKTLSLGNRTLQDLPTECRRMME